MSPSTLALILALASASALGPPALPPDAAPAPTDTAAQPPDDAGEGQAPQPDAGEQGGEQPGEGSDQGEQAADADTPTPPPQLAPPGRRSSLPAGLEPIPNPFDRAPAPPATPGGSPGDPLIPPPAAAPPVRRSVIDLRDPFNRPPPRPNGNKRRAAARMIMPDLKDPFAPGARRVRSKKLSVGLRDIRDPFREGARPDSPRPPCVRTTDDGTVVQAPGEAPAEQPDCQPATLDLRDPFQK